jgi:hypothetical protein
VTVLSPRLLEVLRAYWCLAKPKVWLFAGVKPDRPVALDTARNVFFLFWCGPENVRLTEPREPTKLKRKTKSHHVQ